MDIRSTKTRPEREDEEADRLVRPNPKYKPPRRDRRREMVDENDVDPDAAADRRDKNARIVAARHLWAMEFGTEDELKQYLKKHPDADPRNHSVKKQEAKPPAEEGTPDGKPQAKPETEETPGKNLGAIGGQLRQLAKTDKALGAQLKLFQPGGFYDGMAKEDPNFDITRLPWSKALPKELQSLTLGDIRDALLKAVPPKGKEAPPTGEQPAPGTVPPEAKPGEATVPPEAQAPGQTVPPEAKGKVQKQPGAVPLKRPKAPERDNYDTDEEFKASQDLYKKQLADYKGQVEKQKSGPKPLRKDFESEEEFEAALGKYKAQVSDSDKALQDIDLEENPPAPEEPEPEVPEPRFPARPKPTVQDMVQSREQLQAAFGDANGHALATKVHPEDVPELVDMFQAMSSKPPDNIGEYAAKVSAFYETDPNKVPAPKAGANAAGDTVPFDQLTPDEQGAAWKRHQLRTVAISMAAERGVKDAIQKTLPKGADAELAGVLAAAMLIPEGEKRAAWSRKAADRSYQTAIGANAQPIPPANVQKLIASLGDNEDAKRVAVGYLQGQDFNIAKNVFLTRGPGMGGMVSKGLDWLDSAAKNTVSFLWDLLAEPDDMFQKDDDEETEEEDDDDDAEKVASNWVQISEHSSPKQIGKGIRGAVDFMKLRARNYPEDLLGDRDPAAMFQQQVLGRVRKLDPAKYAPLKAYLEEHDFNDYEEAQASHEQRQAEWEQNKDLELSQSHGSAPTPPSRKKFKTDDEFQQADAAHRESAEERRAAEWSWERAHPKPKAPIKPANYDKVRNPRAVKDMRKWLLAEQFAQHGGKQAAMVAARHVISSYPKHRMMASVSDKTAVYHGVAPYKDTQGYPKWAPAHQRDLGDVDLEVILKSARGWMTTPVLKTPLGDATRDSQLRAALDLAIYDSRYNGQIQPAIYNTLLARLAGANESETLLTQRKQGTSPEKVKPMKASTEIRKLAAKYACENAPLAYDLMDLATKLAEDEQAQQGQGQEQQKQAQDQAQQEQAEQEQGKQASDKYAALRTQVIQAAHQNPAARPAFIPVLQAIKGLDV